MNVTFSETALKQYIEWQTEDRKTLKRINALMKDILRTGPAVGIGRPEIMKHRKARSREIDKANRLVYNFDEQGNLLIIACKGHYDDK